MEDVERITVLLADDNLIVREGVRALLARDEAVEVVGVAGDYDELVAQSDALRPQVLVTDIRMPPTFQNEGIEGAKEVRKRLPGTGVVVLSQYDSPEYAVELLASGAAGYAYLLKDRVADGGRLSRAIREVATGGSMLDPEIVRGAGRAGAGRRRARRRRRSSCSSRSPRAGRSRRSPPRMGSTPEAVNDMVEDLFLALAKGASAGQAEALRRLRMLHTAILQREEQGETLSRMLPGGLAEKLRSDRSAAQRTERHTVTVLMSDVRGYTDHRRTCRSRSMLAGQLNAHRQAMNAAILSEGGTVMQYVGDAVMAVFGAPDPHPGHAAAAIRAAVGMHERQDELNCGLGCRGSGAVRAWHRAVDGRGRGGVARQCGAARVHGRRRHREPRPAAAGSGPAGGHDRGERRDGRARRCPVAMGVSGVEDGQGPGGAGRRLPALP